VAALPALSEYELVDRLPSSDLLTEEAVRTWDVGIGTDVFLAGRYQPPNGVSIPTVRFGNISHPVIGVSDGSGQTMPSYLVAGRTHCDFSGSAVVVRSSVLATALGDQSTQPSTTLIPLDAFDRWILGVHWGYASEFQEATIQMQRGEAGRQCGSTSTRASCSLPPRGGSSRCSIPMDSAKSGSMDEGKILACRETQRERE
jgi:hypothetical protein